MEVAYLLPDSVWDGLLSLLSTSDAKALRSTCRVWKDDVTRSLHHLQLHGASAALVQRAAATFPGITSLSVSSPDALAFDVIPLTSFKRLLQLSVVGLDTSLLLINGSALQRCSRITTLRLQNCTLWEAPWATLDGECGLPQLHTLELTNCGLEALRGSLTARLAALPALRSLSLDFPDHLQLPGMAQGLGQLSALTRLELMVRCLAGRGLWTELGSLVNLRWLTVQVMWCLPGCEFELVELESVLPDMTQLQALSVRGHDCVSDRDLQMVSRVSSLTSANLGLMLPSGSALAWAAGLGLAGQPGGALMMGSVTARGVLALTQLKGLTSLGLARVSAGVEALHAMSALTQLIELDVSGCPGVDDSLLFKLRGSTLLRCLQLKGCTRLSSIGLAAISRFFPALTQLDVSGCGALTDVGVSQLTALRRLQHLGLAECEWVTDIGVQILCEARPPLLSLNLRCCTAITDSGVSHIASHLPCLQRLHLDYCSRVSASGLSALSALRALTELSLVETRYSARRHAHLLAHVRHVTAATRSGWWMR